MPRQTLAAPTAAQSPSCGNGVVEAGEQCDDGNTFQSDGCSAACQLQAGFNCPVPNSRCLPDSPTFTGSVSRSTALGTLLGALAAFCAGFCLKCLPASKSRAKPPGADSAAQSQAPGDAPLNSRTTARAAGASQHNDEAIGALSRLEMQDAFFAGRDDASDDDNAIADDDDDEYIDPGDGGPYIALELGQEVKFKGRPAVVRYIGTTEFASGEWIGLEMLAGAGRHDGSYLGRRYFSCKRAGNVGMFARRGAIADPDLLTSSRQLASRAPSRLPSRRSNMAVRTVSRVGHGRR